MFIGKLAANALDAWVNKLIATRNVIGVQARQDRFAFGPLARAADLRLDYDVSILPPKIFFQPPCEVMLDFTGPAEFKSSFPRDDFILLGVHPYDMAAINQMDRVFAAGNSDEHYFNRRRRATIIGCDVQNPSPNVFAGCMDAAVVREGFDILLTRIPGTYLAEAFTGKGERLLAEASGLRPAGSRSLKAREKVWEDNRLRLRRHKLKAPLADLPDLLARSYDHPVWAENAKKCFSCGSCNLVCPTCYCFDMRDELNWDLKSGRRVRFADGCLLRDFAVVAGGHNFRARCAERYRHRFFRKGKYVPAKIGAIACVGCGRCISACVAKIANPVDIFNRILEDN